jgi:hypothetical protein
MLADLDNAIARLLKQELAPDLANKITVTFNVPDANFPPKGLNLPALNLYLYDLRENLEQRSNEVTVVRQPNGTIIETPPPVRVDCSYIVTAWTDPRATDPATDEHAILGQVMAVLLAHPVIQSDAEKGGLQTANVPTPAKGLRPDNRLDTASLIQLMGGRHKLSLNYTVTIEVQVGVPQATPMVTDKYLKFRVIPGVNP